MVPDSGLAIIRNVLFVFSSELTDTLFLFSLTRQILLLIFCHICFLLFVFVTEIIFVILFFTQVKVCFYLKLLFMF